MLSHGSFGGSFQAVGRCSSPVGRRFRLCMTLRSATGGSRSLGPGWVKKCSSSPRPGWVGRSGPSSGPSPCGAKMTDLLGQKWRKLCGMCEHAPIGMPPGRWVAQGPKVSHVLNQKVTRKGRGQILSVTCISNWKEWAVVCAFFGQQFL